MTSTGTRPQLKPTTLYVVAAFDRGEDGDLKPAFQPQQMPSESAAIGRAKLMHASYAGVIAWSRAARPDEGEFGEPIILWRHGEVPQMG